MTREDDARVAEILGWEKPSDTNNGCIFWISNRNEIQVNGLPHFTTDPAADYKVLEWVRGSFPNSSEALREFVFLVEQACLDRGSIMSRGAPDFFLMYQPGDYSRALLTLKDKGLL